MAFFQYLIPIEFLDLRLLLEAEHVEILLLFRLDLIVRGDLLLIL